MSENIISQVIVQVVLLWEKGLFFFGFIFAILSFALIAAFVTVGRYLQCRTQKMSLPTSGQIEKARLKAIQAKAYPQALEARLGRN